MRKAVVAGVVSFGVLAGCGSTLEPPMIKIMQTCDTGIKFSEYVSCIKENYKRSPDSDTVVSFYAQIDAVTEDYNRGKLTETKAKAKAFELYDATIGAGNRALQNRPVTNTTVINRRGVTRPVNPPTSTYKPPIYSPPSTGVFNPVLSNGW